MMQNSFPKRKSPRLRGYDYSQNGAYFVTMVTHLREHLFGAITDGEMVLSPMGEIAAARWVALPEHHEHIELDVFVVMPNHFHGVLVITGASHSVDGGAVGTQPAASGKPSPPPLLGHVIRSYKSSVTRQVRQAEGDRYQVVWQGRYHDRIIRNQRELDTIRAYVMANPSRWDEDTLNG